MRQSKLFYRTLKEKPKDAQAVSHELLARAGFIDQLMAGVYTFLPLGFRVLKKIEEIIRKNMLSIGAQEMLMPALNPRENWEKTGRWQSLEILFKLKGAGDKEYALAPTHEEVISPLVKKIAFSYKDFPYYLFHIQNKFRNELRAKSGLLRTREFLMKDLYSFHNSQEDLERYYEKVAKTYFKIFNECGLGKYTYRTFASGGSFSKYSDEFQTITPAGEDIIYVCQKCKLAINKEIKEETPYCPSCKSDKFEENKAVEVGNIFKLGTNYSLPFDLKFKDKEGREKPVLMGCYGIGISRVMAAIVEVNHDERGIIWPKAVAPFLVHLIALEKDKKVRKNSEKLFTELQKRNIEVLYDDREDKTPGEKLVEADLIGIPYRLIVSKKTLEKGSVELKERNKKTGKLIKANQVFKYKF